MQAIIEHILEYKTNYIYMLNPFIYRLKTIVIWHYFSQTKYLDKKILIFDQYRTIDSQYVAFLISDIVQTNVYGKIRDEDFGTFSS